MPYYNHPMFSSTFSYSLFLCILTQLLANFQRVRLLTVTLQKYINSVQGPYTSGHLKFKAIRDFSRLFEKEIQDCFNNIMYFYVQ